MYTYVHMCIYMYIYIYIASSIELSICMDIWICMLYRGALYGYVCSLEELYRAYIWRAL